MSGQNRKASGSTRGCLTDHKTKTEYEQQALPDERQALAEKYQALTERQGGKQEIDKFGLGFPQGNGSPSKYPEPSTPQSKTLQPQLEHQRLLGPQPRSALNSDTVDSREAEKVAWLNRICAYASKIHDPDSAAAKFLDKELENEE
jgi:hypothetical protein